MSRRIKGITIEIDGDVTGLNKALKGVEGNIRGTNKELRDVDRLLRFNPKSTELLAQQQQLLAKQVSNTSEKLKGLKSAQEQVNRSFKDGEMSGEQYRAFQREIAETESKLSHYESRLSEVDSSHRTFGEHIEHAGRSTKALGQGMTSVGHSMTAVSAPVIGLGVAIAKTGMDFEQSMAQVQATSGASAKDMENLEAKARDLGQTTVWSAKEVADGFNYMALAGWDTQQSIDGIDGVLNLATAAGMDLANASDIVTDSLSMFGMEAGESGRMADVLAQASSSTNTSVEQMGEALKYVGASANAANMDIEQTSAMIGILADNGIKGSSAGTTLNSMLRDMQAKAKDGTMAIGDMNVEVFNSKGEMRDLGSIMADVEKATDGMSDAQKQNALSQYFGSEAMRGVNIVLEEGSGKYADLEKKMYGASGSAEKMAEIMGETTQGKLKGMQSAISELALKLYDALQPALEWVFEAVTKLANWVGNLNPKILQTVVVIGAVVAALAPLLIILGTLLQAIGSIMTTFGSLFKVISGVGKLLLGANPVLLAIVAVLAVVGYALYKLWTESETFREIMTNAFNAVKNVVKTVMEFISEFIQAIWGLIMDFWEENGERIKEVTTTVWEAIKSVFEVVMPIIEGIVTVVWEVIKMVITTVMETVLNIIETVLGIITGLFKVFSSFLKGDWEGLWEGIKSITQTITDFLVKLIENSFFMKLVKGMADFVKGFGDVFKKMWEGLKDFLGKIVKAMVDQVKKNWEQMRNDTKRVFDAIKKIATTVWNGIKKAITKVVDAIKNNVTKSWEAIKNTTKKVFEAVKNSMVKPIEKARDLIKKAIDKIKGFFKNMKLKFPKIQMPKLPKFSLNGKFSFNPPSVPKLSVSWHAKGGIFNKPTLFNTANGLHGVGEAGSEAIIPLKPSVLAGIGKGIAEQMDMSNGNIEAVHVTVEPAPILLDGEVIAEATFETTDKKMGSKQLMNRYIKGVK